jgi:uncharacterized membrane protein
MHYWFYGGHMIWMTISWLVGVGLLVTFIWLLVDALRGPSTGNASAEEILRRRYATGEIDTNEYERHLDELRKTKSAA